MADNLYQGRNVIVCVVIRFQCSVNKSSELEELTLVCVRHAKLPGKKNASIAVNTIYMQMIG